MSTISLARAIDLITSKYTAQLLDRQAYMIKKLCGPNSPYADGFLYREIEQLIELFALLFARIQEGTNELIPALKTLLSHCKHEFRKEKTSDEIKYVPRLPEFLRSLEPMLAIDAPPAVIVAVTDFLCEFARRETQDAKQKEIEGEDNAIAYIKKKGTKYLLAIKATFLPDRLVLALAGFVNQPAVAGPIVAAISAFSVFSELAVKMGKNGVLKDLVALVCAQNFRDAVVQVSIDCVWNILEQCDDQAIETLASEELILSIRHTLEHVIKAGYKLEDRKLRNELCILLCNIAQSPKTHKYFLYQDEGESFLQELLRLSSIDELQLSGITGINTGRVQTMWKTEVEDLEMKKLLWTCVARIMSSSEEEALSLVSQSDFLSAVLLYLDPNQNSTAITRWQEPQLRDLQEHALSTLFHVLPLVPEQFQKQNGNYCLVNFLAAHNDPERKFNTLRVLELASQFPEYKVELAEEGLFDILFDIINSDHEYSLEIREMAFSVVSNACRECRENQKEFRRKGWIELLQRNLRNQAPTVVGEPEHFILSVLDCLWHAVLKNKRSLLHFIDIDGVNVLLDYLDESPEVHRRHLISCLCMLLYTRRAQVAFLNWNSKKSMCNATQLLIRLYEAEEQRLGVKYTEDGVLGDTRRPLTNVDTGPKTYERLRAALEAAEQSESGLVRKKLIEFVRKRDMRASIHTLMSLTSFASSELLPRERQKLEVIRMYPSFRKGELWQDIQAELQSLAIRPINDDRHLMECEIEDAYEHALHTVKMQAMIAHDQKKLDEQGLGSFYETITKQKGQ